MTTPIIRMKSWREFHDFAIGYAANPRERREQFLFRGHSDSGWPLITTLDRHRSFSDDPSRTEHYNLLLAEFRREAFGVGPLSLNLPKNDAFELLARHHGVPSPFLDWTGSPYIASFFAFDGATDPKRSVSIFVFDRGRFLPRGSEVDLIDDPESIRLNRRALQQQGSFIRINTIREAVEDLLGSALSKIVMPARIRRLALTDLDEMTITAASLFADLDGAARTARTRASL